MSFSLVISDLHLSESHPRTIEQFIKFVHDDAPQAEALFILGDMFEYWAGDDDIDTPFHHRVCDALSSLASSDTRLYIMHGNRDFLMDEALADACRGHLLSDPSLVDLYGHPTLLTHGDTLCTDDKAYQEFRAMVRSPEWRSQFLSQPLSQRKATIEQLRAQSEQSKHSKAMEIMDVSDVAVHGLLRRFNYPRLIHGHTHRPAKHTHLVDGHSCERWVLGDWDTQANALQVDASGIRQLAFS